MRHIIKSARRIGGVYIDAEQVIAEAVAVAVPVSKRRSCLASTKGIIFPKRAQQNVTKAGASGSAYNATLRLLLPLLLDDDR